jgi:diguanylate cyclase (GGDEF)-like protein
MLSLTRAINRLDREERRYKAALDCYLSAIAALGEYPLDTTPEMQRTYKHALREIHTEVSQTDDAEILEKSRKALRSLLKNYYRGAATVASERADDLRAVIGALGEAAQLLGEHHVAHAEQLRKFTDRLQTTEKVTDLRQMRREIVSHVADLRIIGAAAKQEDSQALASLQQELSEFGKRLESAEQRACLDGLTGLLNRGEGEIRLNRMVESGRTASAILVDLNAFKTINDSWGHSAGDQVLKACGAILSDSTRSGDLVCRWGGDEFLVIIQCEEAVARERAKTMKERLRRPQKIVVGGRLIEVAVSASMGVTKLRDNESALDFIARVDQEMYREKDRKTFDSCPVAPS